MDNKPGFQERMETDDKVTSQAEQTVTLSRQDQRSIAINGIFILLVFYTLYFAAPVLVPITLAILLNLLFSPPVRLLSSWGLPRILSALTVVALAVVLFMITVYALSGPAQQWVEKVPGSFYKIEQKLRFIKKPIEETKKAIEKVEDATELGKKTDVNKVQIERPSLTDTLFSGALERFASVGVVIILLFFLLSSGDAFLRKLVEAIPSFHDKKRAVDIIRNIEEDISFYLLTMTITNICVGLAVGIAMAILGVPNPHLWGVLATILSYAPYVGPAVITGLMAIVGMITFDNVWMALATPVTYLFIAIMGSNVILPIVLGRRLTLSPVAIFIAIIIWGWLWGVVGALAAVPLLASFKIICERVVPLKPISEFLTP